MQIPPWLVFALLSAGAAALTGLFAKIGLEGIDSTLATVIRSFIGTVYLIGFATVLGKWSLVRTMHLRAVLMIVLAGVAGASSWLFYYRALSYRAGELAKVAAIDKLSVPLTVVLAVVLLREKLLLINWLGVVLVVAGIYLVAVRPSGT